MNSDQVRRLLSIFKDSQYNARRVVERSQRNEYNHSWIIKSESLSDEALKQNFLEYYQGGEGRQSFRQVYRDRIILDIGKFRKMLSYLLNESLPIGERFSNLTQGAQHIEGFGRALASAFLMDMNPQKYCLWNGKTESGFKVLGWDLPYTSQDSEGSRYTKVLRKLTDLRDKIGSGWNLSFNSVDLFLHWIVAEEEGKNNVIEILTQGRPKKLALIGAVNNKGREKNYEVALSEAFNQHKHTWTGWTYTLIDDMKKILEDYVREGKLFNFYFYMSKSGHGSGLIEQRLQIDKFIFDSNGKMSPEPEICCKDDLDMQYKAWFHVTSIEKLDPPLDIQKFQKWDENHSLSAQGLQNTFEFVKDITDSRTLLPSKAQVEQAARFIGKPDFSKEELFEKLEEILEQEQNQLRPDWREVTWSRILYEWAEMIIG